MTKFHINKHGVPAPCKAKSGNCPLGGDDQHFNTREEAQIAADQRAEKEFGTLPLLQQLNIKRAEKIDQIVIHLEDRFQNSENDYFDASFEGFAIEADYYSHQRYESPITDPVKKVDEYFDAAIRKHAGEDIDLDDYDHDWESELLDNRKEYYTVDVFEDNYSSGGGYNEAYQEEYFEKDLESAENLNEIYDSHKRMINELVEEVQKVDWTELYSTQKEGEIEALKAIKAEGYLINIEDCI